jgi:hypothetical protein
MTLKLEPCISVAGNNKITVETTLNQRLTWYQQSINNLDETWLIFAGSIVEKWLNFG